MAKTIAPKTNGGTLVLPRKAVVLAESVRNTWEGLITDEAPRHALLDPAALSTSAQFMHPRDMIYLQNVSGTRLEIYRVTYADARRVYCALLQEFDIKPAQVDTSEEVPGFRFGRDEARGWYIERLSDGCIMGTQRDNPSLRDKEACRRHVLDHASMKQAQA